LTAPKVAPSFLCVYSNFVYCLFQSTTTTS